MGTQGTKAVLYHPHTKTVIGRASNPIRLLITLIVPPGFTAPKVMWLLKHEPEHYGRMRYCCLLHDYVIFVLTEKKELTTDAGDASGTGIFDTCTRELDLELARAAAKDEKYASALPRVLRPMEIAGTLTEEWKLKVNSDPENLFDIKVSGNNHL